MTDHVEIQPPLTDSLFLQNVPLENGITDSYLIDLWSISGTEIQIDVVKGKQDWGVHFSVSEDPGSTPLNRRLPISQRSAYSLKINGNDLEVWYGQATYVFTLFTRVVGQDYYLNLQNNETATNQYFIRVNMPPPLGMAENQSDPLGMAIGSTFIVG